MRQDIMLVNMFAKSFLSSAHHAVDVGLVEIHKPWAVHSRCGKKVRIVPAHSV
jgi:hypothetical protein